MTKSTITMALAICGVGLCASPVSASVLVTSQAFNAGFDATAPNTIDFDRALPAQFTLTGGLVRSLDDALGAPPAIAAGVKDRSAYLSVNPGDGATLIGSTAFQSVSLLWGSIDSYNTLRLLGQDGATIASYAGLDVFAPANGDQRSGDTNRRVTFTSTDTSQGIYGIALQSSQPAFEIDDVTFTAPVPEPSSWALMIGGLCVVGAAMRRRQTVRVRFA